MSPKSLLLPLLLLATPAFATDYVQAPGSALSFAGKYQGEVFTGRFPGFSTRFSFDPAQLATAKLEVTVPLATATTGNDDYDANLRGEDFFASAKFARARYTATKFRASRLTVVTVYRVKADPLTMLRPGSTMTSASAGRCSRAAASRVST